MLPVYTIRKLGEGDIPAYAKLQLNAYPVMTQTQSQYEEFVSGQINSAGTEYYGAFDGDKTMAGAMIIYDYRMNLLGNIVCAGGIGSVAVDLCQRNRRVAKEMLGFFLRKLPEDGAPVALLYPFNPAFYKKMGFGLGARLSQFRLRPSELPQCPHNVRQLTVSDAGALLNFYNREAGRRNGLILTTLADMEHTLKRQAVKAFASYKNGQITGYAFTQFKRGGDSFLVNDLIVTELLFEDGAAYAELMGFFGTLAGEFRYIVINTQDEELAHSLGDARYAGSEKLLYSVYHESSLSGAGIMYRVTDAGLLFAALAAEHDFGGVSVKLRLELKDSFIPENNGVYILHVDNGRLIAVPGGEYDVTLSIGIAEFSSLITCVADLRSLHRYGLCRLSDDTYLNTLHRMFASADKPLCTTQF